MQRITFTSSFEDAAATDLVIEAVPERLELKIRVFRDLDRLAPPATILASNTSGLPIAALAASTDRPDRVIGWHWASPAPVMKLAEIVVTPETSDATVAIVTDAATRCGKHPVVVKDNPMQWGFVANRVYFAMVREAQRVVDEGIATRAEVDQLMMDCLPLAERPVRHGRRRRLRLVVIMGRLRAPLPFGRGALVDRIMGRLRAPLPFESRAALVS